MSGHLDLDRLADLLAGEGSDADVAHVGDCAGCAGRLDELAAAEVHVAAVLAALPPPELPAGLADRLTAALAAEPALPPSTEQPEWSTGADGAATRTVTPFPRAGAARGRSPRRWAPVAAAAALLVAAGTLGGGVLLAQRSGDDADTSTAASGDAGGGAGEDLFAGVPRNSTGRDYAAEGVLAATLPQLLEGGAAPETSTASDRAAAPGGDPAPAEAPVEDADLAPAETLAEARTESRSATATGLDRLREPQALASCLAAVLPPEEDVLPLAVDYAVYGAEPALVVVLPATRAPDKVDVYVVGAGCRQGDDQTRFFARLDRPAG